METGGGEPQKRFANRLLSLQAKHAAASATETVTTGVREFVGNVEDTVLRAKESS